MLQNFETLLQRIFLFQKQEAAKPIKEVDFTKLVLVLKIQCDCHFQRFVDSIAHESDDSEAEITAISDYILMLSAVIEWRGDTISP